MSRDVPEMPEKTTDLPSGEKAGERGMSGATGIRSTTPPPRAEKMKSWRPRSRRAKTAIRSPSGAKERSRPLSGPCVRNWAEMYSYFVVRPGERFFQSFRVFVERRAMSMSSLYVVSVATKSPDGDGAAPIS